MKNTAYFHPAFLMAFFIMLLSTFACHAEDAPAAASGTQTAVITLNNRTPQDVISVITPFLEKGGQVKGFENQLIIQSSASNIAALKDIIAKIDVATKKLMITVSNGHNKPSEVKSISANGDVTFGEETDNTQSLEISTNRESDTQVSSIPVDNGNVAFIKTGVTIPLIQDQYAGQGSYNSNWQVKGAIEGGGSANALGREVDQSYDYKNLSNGFYVKPQVIGKEVKLELSTSNDQPSGVIGDTTTAAYTTFNAQTTITVPLAKWTYFGGNESQDRPDSTTSYHTRSRDQSQKSLWLRVDLVPESGEAS